VPGGFSLANWSRRRDSDSDRKTFSEPRQRELPASFVGTVPRSGNAAPTHTEIPEKTAGVRARRCVTKLFATLHEGAKAVRIATGGVILIAPQTLSLLAWRPVHRSRMCSATFRDATCVAVPERLLP